MFRKVIAPLAVSAAAVLGISAPAQAAQDDNRIVSVSSSVHVTGEGTAYIHGVYNCAGGTQAHLWVSAKQGSTSGFAADAWWDTNYAFSESDPDGITATCDGKNHNVKIEIHPTPFKETGVLEKGVPTYIQFCLVNGPTEDFAASKMFWGTTV